MRTPIQRFVLATLTLVAAAAQAQPGPPPGGPPRDALALAPGFDAATVKDVRRIDNERRDAHDQLAIRQRGEHARIDEEADDKLRKRLGDENYRKYLEWKTQAAGPRGSRGDRGPGSARGADGVDAQRGRPDKAPAQAPGDR